ncbi:MAG: HD domain-containing protein [Candidatus Moraniibacteriota bacterium]
MENNAILLQKTKELMLGIIAQNGSDPWCLTSHLPEAQKWARFLTMNHPEADSEVVVLSVWLHDSGHYPITPEDHAIKSEKIAKDFLEKEKFNPAKLALVLHCVRAHRCKDVQPESLEAKILACADSASHMTDSSMYPSMLRDKRAVLTLEKLERDYRDTKSFPEVQEKLKDFYEAWKKILTAYIKLDLE